MDYWIIYLSFCLFSYNGVQFLRFILNRTLDQYQRGHSFWLRYILFLQMYVLDTKEQSVSDKKLLSVLKFFFSKWVCALILIERVIKNELKELYSIVRKQAKWERNNTMETTELNQFYGSRFADYFTKCWSNPRLNPRTQGNAFIWGLNLIFKKCPGIIPRLVRFVDRNYFVGLTWTVTT